MKTTKRRLLFLIAAICLGTSLGGCGQQDSGAAIIRIGHNQSTNHPTHIALTAFESFIEEKLGDKYNIEVFPSELLGSQNEMVQLTQTGAINFCVASNSLLETFEITGSDLSVFHPFLLRLPGIVIVCIYIMTVGLRLAPDEPPVAISASSPAAAKKEEAPLPP